MALIPKARPMRAASAPTWPRPRTPKVRPSSSGPIEVTRHAIAPEVKVVDRQATEPPTTARKRLQSDRSPARALQTQCRPTLYFSPSERMLAPLPGGRMGVSKQQTVENRKAIIGAATRLFRERGVEAVGLNELMAAAGFTRGGFYNHFKCKDDLVAAVMMAAVEEGMARLDRAIEAARSAGQYPLRSVIGWFLPGDHRQDLFEACPPATFDGDLPRLDESVRRTSVD